MSTVARTSDGGPPVPGGLPDDPVHAVANRLHSLAIHVLRAARVDDPELGVTPERLSVLSVLVYGGPMTLGGLAHAEQVTPPAITRHVTALERDGLVTREPVPGDRRASRVRATARGRRLVERGRRNRVRRVGALLSQLDGPDLAAVDRATTAVLRMLPSR